MHAIGIDIGTTSICGVLIDAKDGRLIKSHTVAGDAFIRTDFAWEKLQDVDKIISVARELLYELADHCCVGFCGQWRKYRGKIKRKQHLERHFLH